MVWQNFSQVGQLKGRYLHFRSIVDTWGFMSDKGLTVPCAITLEGHCAYLCYICGCCNLSHLNKSVVAQPYMERLWNVHIFVCLKMLSIPVHFRPRWTSDGWICLARFEHATRIKLPLCRTYWFTLTLIGKVCGWDCERSENVCASCLLKDKQCHGR